MEENTKEKLSYEQLENVARQLSDQVKQAYAKMQEMNMVNLYKRLDYLFKVVDCSYAFDEEFIDKCATEIKDLLTIPEQTEEEKKEE